MKKVLFLIVLLISTDMLWAVNKFGASDARITYVGRTEVRGKEVSFDWTGTYVKVSFVGKKLSLKLRSDATSTIENNYGTEPLENLHNFVNVYVDGGLSTKPTKTFHISKKDTTLVLCEFKKKGKHTVTLLKRTEGEQGRLILKEFLTDGTLQQAPKLKKRQIEFVGDSYTCGYGVRATIKDCFTPMTEDQSGSYANILCRYFDADYIAVAHSGWGIARNYADRHPETHMPDKYNQTFDIEPTSPWIASKHPFKPAITVIYLGANDFSSEVQPHYPDFQTNYQRLLEEIKSNYGANHPILCCTPKGPSKEGLLDYVRDVVNTCGLKNVYYVGLAEALHHNTNVDTGADMHPNYNGQKKIAYTLIPYIATLTGWELQDKLVK